MPRIPLALESLVVGCGETGKALGALWPAEVDCRSPELGFIMGMALELIGRMKAGCECKSAMVQTRQDTMQYCDVVLV